MLPDFHYAAWAAAWLGIFKGLLWLFLDPNLPGDIAGLVQVKQALLMVPFILCAIGVWNRRRWAAVGLIGAAVIDLMAAVFIPGSMSALFANQFPPYAAVLVLFVGPGASILILTVYSALMSMTEGRGNP